MLKSLETISEFYKSKFKVYCNKSVAELKEFSEQFSTDSEEKIKYTNSYIYNERLFKIITEVIFEMDDYKDLNKIKVKEFIEIYNKDVKKKISDIINDQKVFDDSISEEGINNILIHLNVIESLLKSFIDNIFKMISSFITDESQIIDDFDLSPLKGFIFLDVETVGFAGEPFAVGYITTNIKGDIINEVCYYYEPDLSDTDEETKDWITKNCLENLRNKTIKYTLLLESKREFITLTKASLTFLLENYWVVADCPYPCEARLLNLCELYTEPYPIIDLSSILLFNGFNPLGTYERKEDELPKHNPLADARQTRRLFFHLQENKLDLIKSEI